MAVTALQETLLITSLKFFPMRSNLNWFHQWR